MQVIFEILSCFIAIFVFVYCVRLILLQIKSSGKLKQEILNVQMSNTYYKPQTFELNSNGGINPCDKDEVIEATEIIGLNQTALYISARSTL